MITLDQIKRAFPCLDFTPKHAAEWLKCRNIGKVRFNVLKEAGLVIGETDEDHRKAREAELELERTKTKDRLAKLDRAIALWSNRIKIWKEERKLLKAKAEKT